MPVMRKPDFMLHPHKYFGEKSAKDLSKRNRGGAEDTGAPQSIREARQSKKNVKNIETHPKVTPHFYRDSLPTKIIGTVQTNSGRGSEGKQKKYFSNKQLIFFSDLSENQKRSMVNLGLLYFQI